MTTVDIFNLALMKIGVTKGITALNESSIEATVGSRVYDHLLRLTLRRFPWPFATKYAGDDDNNPFYLVRGPLWDDDPTVLTSVQAWSSTATYAIGDVVRSSSINYTCIVGNTNTAPPNTTYWSTSTSDYPDYASGDWLYAYRWPTDCLFARRLVNTGSQRRYDPDPYTWRIGRDVNGLLIYTNTPRAILEYTMIDCANLYTDDLFIDAFTWRLAAYLAPSLAKNGLTTDACLKYSVLAMQEASAVASQEQQQEKDDGPDWMLNR